MKVFVPRERTDGEARVAMIPAVARKLVKDGAQVVVEPGAGQGSHFPDEAYAEAGAAIGDAWSDADVVLTIHPPLPEAIDRMKAGAVLIGSLAPQQHADRMRRCAERNVTAIAMELIPRITRAQSMDTLSSQANVAGYKAVILGAAHAGKLFPMMITAAGTLAPAKVFIIGVGVAGLQAIATAKRLGAIVEAYDVRAATKEQVQSLGARFVELQMEKQEDQATGGYAKEQTEEERRKQAAMMSRHVIGADVVVCTAAVPGKAPPMLIPTDVVAQMHAGSVIVDMAASPEHGRGNCELTKPGEIFTTSGGVVLVGTLNLPATLPVHASQAYAGNMASLLKELVVDSRVKINLEDEIQNGAVVTHAGTLRKEL